MLRTIAIGLLGLAIADGAGAQTPAEQSRILGEFQRSVADYTQRHQCLDMFPEAINAATPAPRIFTPPVAMVFRQLIARSLAERDGVAAINGTGLSRHPSVLTPLPAAELHEFPRVLEDALPPVPAHLEYRLIGHDLVIRDQQAGVIVAVLRDAVGTTLTVQR